MKCKPILMALCGLACAPFARAQNPAIAAAFAAAPFQQWIAQGPKAELPWHPRVTPPTLTLHQRMAVRVEVELDGTEGRVVELETACLALAYHRRELMRQRALLQSVWSWYLAPLVPGLLVFGKGVSSKHDSRFIVYMCMFALVFGGVGWLNHRGAVRLGGREVDRNIFRGTRAELRARLARRPP